MIRCLIKFLELDSCMSYKEYLFGTLIYVILAVLFGYFVDYRHSNELWHLFRPAIFILVVFAIGFLFYLIFCLYDWSKNNVDRYKVAFYIKNIIFVTAVLIIICIILLSFFSDGPNCSRYYPYC